MSNNELKLKANLPSYLFILLYVVLIIVLLYFINGQSLIGIDDANIYMVYMRNFAAGRGFVFNIGGERVEGFTSVLWTLTGSLFYVIGKWPEIFMLILNLLIVSFAVWRICCFINAKFNNPRFLSGQVILFLALLISLPGYFEWTVLTLMETGLWSSLLILSVLNILEYHPDEAKKSDIPFSILVFLTIITRPEAVLWCGFFLVMRFLKIYSYVQIRREAMIRMVLPVMVYVLTIILLYFWQYSYFGYLFPNTYYAKVSSDRYENIRAGMKYLAEYFKGAPFVFLIFILLLNQIISGLKDTLSVDPLKLRKSFPLLVLTGVFLITFALPLFSGGDHFAYYRMIQPTVPLFLLYFFLAADYYHFVLNRLWKLLILFFVIISSNFSLFYTVRNMFSPLKVDWDIAVNDRNTSKKLNDYFDVLLHYPSQGVVTTGGSAYAYKGVTNDLLGLNNTKMAHADPIKDNWILKDHASFNKAVFYEQTPDLFWLTGKFNPKGVIDKMSIPSNFILLFKGIAEEEKFHKEYTQCIIFRKDKPENLQIFASEKFLNSLDTAYYKVVRFNGPASYQ